MELSPASRRDQRAVARGHGNYLQDLRLAFRLLFKRPALTGIIVATVAIGVGANTVILTVAHSVLLKPLPYPEADRLVNLYRIDPRVTGDNPTPATLFDLYAVPPAVFRDWRDQSRAFEHIGAYEETGFTLTGRNRPERISGLAITSGVLQALGVQPALGRPALEHDDRIGAPGVAVLSHGLWQSRFGADPDVIGQSLNLNGVPHTIVGVMPAGFFFPSEREQIWATLSDGRKQSSIRNSGFLQVIARLGTGVSLSEAREEMRAVAGRIGETHVAEKEHGIGVYPRLEIVTAPVRNAILLWLGIGGLVLLIACANIAGLLLVRANERRKEISVRAALGAQRSRLAAQLAVESLVLALLGGAFGALVAITTLTPLIALFPNELPRAAEITVDYWMLAFAFTLSLLTGLLIGLLPALRSARTSISAVLQGTSRSFSGGREHARAQSALVVAQVTLTFALLACALLFTKSFFRLISAENGFDAVNVLTAPVVPPAARWSSAEDVGAFYDDLMTQLRSLPGVQEVGTANQMPYISGLSFPPVEVETDAEVEEQIIHVASVTPSYLTALDIPVVSGRGFDDGDREDSLPVTLVNQTMVRRLWPDESPLGRRVGLGSPDSPAWHTVVGVIGDVRYGGGADLFPELYIPFAQRPQVFEWLVIKTANDAAAVTPLVRDTLRAANPELPLSVNLLAEQISSSRGVRAPRFGALTVAVLAGVALLLAVLGIYGLLAYSVTQRTSEIGIRMALGAGRQSVLQDVLVRGLRLAGAGLVLGVALALLFSQVLESMLFGVSPNDAGTLIEVALLVLAASLAASFLPARRAMHINPIDALRQE